MNRHNQTILVQWIVIIFISLTIALQPLWTEGHFEEIKTEERQEQTWLFDESIVGKYAQIEAPIPEAALAPSPKNDLQQLKMRAVELHAAQSGEDYRAITAMINPENPLPSDYVPEDMSVLNTRSYDGAMMRSEAAQALEHLMADGEGNGYILYVVSAYRSYALQERLHNGYIASMGREAAENESAPAGASEHQSGLAVDLSCDAVGKNLVEAFESTSEGLWVAENAWHYGFIIRYPRDKDHITGYIYEPWHLRYVGEEMASIVHQTGLTLEELYAE